MGGSYSAPKKESRHFDGFVAELPSMDGKSCAITGTTTGMGYHAAKVALQKGATVYCLNRPSERASSALQKLQADSSAASRVHQVECDLQSFDSVRKAAQQLSSACSSGLDVLCNNAGIMAMPDKVTKDGYEQQMQTNHLSHFLLSSLLMPALEKAASARGQARIVNHSSGARKNPGTPLQAKNLEKGEAGSFGGEKVNARYERYHQTKLANMVFTEALQDRLDERKSKVFATVAHPGISASSLQATTVKNDESGMHNFMMKQLMRMSQSEEDGSMPLLQCMCGADTKPRSFYGPSSGGILGPVMKDTLWGPPKQLQAEKLCTDPKSKDLLWEKSEAAVGPFFA